MRRALTILGVALVMGGGASAAVALGAGGSRKDSSTSTATATTPPAKVWLCHHTGSWKHPYHLIHVSSHAVPAHRRHGDADPGAGNSCPTTQPPGARVHGKNGTPGKSEKAGDGKSKPGSRGDGAGKDDADDD
jgi:hypothetical protein